MASPLIPLDTSDEDYRLQCEIYRQMGGAERLAAVFRLNQIVRDTAMAGIRQRHPQYTEEQVAAAFHRLVLGDALTRETWPARELVEP